MNKALYYRVYVPAVTAIGDIMVAFDPPAVREHQIRQVLEMVQPGDIIGRGFDAYLDRLLIPSTYGITHTGFVRTIEHMTHAVAEGVVPIGIIDFIKDADRIVLLRPRWASDELRWEAIDEATILCDLFEEGRSQRTVEYDFLFNDDTKFYCHELTCHLLGLAGIFIPKTAGRFGPWPFRTRRDLYLADDIIDDPAIDTVYAFNLKEDAQP